MDLGFIRQTLQQTRDCGLTTRNQRLATIHALAAFIAERSPEHIAWSAATWGPNAPSSANGGNKGALIATRTARRRSLQAYG